MGCNQQDLGLSENRGMLTSSQMSWPTAKMNGHDIPMDFSTGNAITARPMSCGRALLVSFMAAPVCFCPTERMDPVGFLRKKPLADQPGWSKKLPFWMVKHGEPPCQRPWYIHIFSHSAGMSKRITWNDLCIVGIKLIYNPYEDDMFFSLVIHLNSKDPSAPRIFHWFRPFGHESKQPPK